MAETSKLPPRDAEQRRQNSIAEEEARSRRDESIDVVLRNRAQRNPDSPDSELAQQVAGTTRESADRLREAQAQPRVFDPEGTGPTLADRAGNYALNQEVASAGGIGIDTSNTAGEEPGGPQAKSAEEALEGVKRNAVTGLVYGLGGVPQTMSGEPLEIPAEEQSDEEPDPVPSLESAVLERGNREGKKDKGNRGRRGASSSGAETSDTMSGGDTVSGSDTVSGGEASTVPGPTLGDETGASAEAAASRSSSRGRRPV